MKYSLSWIKQFVALPDTLQIAEFKEKLWQSLSEIESVENLAEYYKGIVIGKILETEKHPNADKLTVTKVDIGNGEVKTVLTGAPNVRKGDYVPYIGVGATVPVTRQTTEPLVIEPREMKGMMSEGMLCSKYELLLGEDHSGILILQEADIIGKLEGGRAFAEALGLDDFMIEIENKSMTHRGDCFSMVGMAREVSAVLDIPFKTPQWLEPKPQQIAEYAREFDESFSSRIQLSVKAKNVVPRYSAIVLEDIVVKESPLWIQAILLKHGIKPINNVVDITNYIMLEWGQPMHAFDAEKISHTVNNDVTTYTVNVRMAKNGEKIHTLDNKEHLLDTNTIVIADADKAIGIAGIIGGTNSSITEKSKKIILESATFDMYSIRKSSMLHGIFTDASTVFSRRQDPSKTVKAMLRAIDFLQLYANAKISSPVEDELIADISQKEKVISAQKARSFIGIEISDKEMVSILKRLHYKVTQKGDLITVVVPSYRQDIEIDEDLYEEIVRVYGYSSVKPTLPNRPIYGIPMTLPEKVKESTASYLRGAGFLETINFSFISEKLYKQAQLETKDCYKIINAVSPDVQYVRKVLAPALIEQAVQNQYVEEHFGLFEFGKVLRKEYVHGKQGKKDMFTEVSLYPQDDFGLPVENHHLGMVTVTNAEPAYYTLKQYIDELLAHTAIGDIHYRHMSELSKKELEVLPLWVTEVSHMTKGGRTAVISSLYDSEHHVFGIIGEVNTPTLRSFSAQRNIVLAELSMSMLQRLYKGQLRHREPSKYPSMRLDYCFELDAEITAKQLLQSVSGAAKSVILNGESIVAGIELVDIYRVNDSKKRMTVRISYESQTKTLTDKEIHMLDKDVISQVSAELNATIV
ncbi:MAG: phenylalanine--tRNA ligase subunit beta [Candidatus Dojkabacteria bacterium]|nr:MAG: phenylalanine--tRNA ligase subunit beta [Candidatus Dojkabacteria bacterium]